MYGISVKKKISAGKSAKKKLKAMDEALVVMAPFSRPFIKNELTSYKFIPLNPGKSMCLLQSIKNDNFFFIILDGFQAQI